MVIGVLQFELLIHGAESLKDKRRVVRSVKDRLHRDHMASVAEVGALDRADLAVMALAVVGNDGERVGDVLDRISARLRALTDAELGECRRDLIHGAAIPTRAEGADGDDDLADELRRYAEGTEGAR